MIRSPKRFLSRLFIFPRIWSVYFRRAVLVVLDPDLRLAINVFPCLDGYTSERAERALFEQVLQTVKSGELWIADRNMCTQGFLLG